MRQTVNLLCQGLPKSHRMVSLRRILRHLSTLWVVVSTRWRQCLRLDVWGTPISTEIVGAPCSNRTETENNLTALSGPLRWKELSAFSPPIRFPDGLLNPSYVPSLLGVGVCRGAWAPGALCRVPPSRRVEGVFFPSLPRRSFPLKMAFPFAFITI